MKDKNNIERLVGTDHDELLRLRLTRLKSSEMCKRLLYSKKEQASLNIEDQKIEIKAIGLSSVIESAMGYFDIKADSLNTKILLRYYALLQLTLAEEVASLRNDFDLSSLQKHTESGHGLATLNNYNNENVFSDNFFCYILQNGHFFKYLKHLKIENMSGLYFQKRIQKGEMNEQIKDKLFSLSDLFRRIPELQKVINEYFDRPALVFNIGYSQRNNENRYKKQEEYSMKTGKFTLNPPEGDQDIKTTYVSIYKSSPIITLDYLKSLKLPFADFEIDFSEGEEEFIFKFDHPKNGVWWDYINTYKSSYSATSYIVPLINHVNDPIIIHFMLLYSLSIIVRYLPEIWYKVTVGDLNHIGNLIEYYISILDHVLPKLMLERITGNKIHISMPGGWDAPI